MKNRAIAQESSNQVDLTPMLDVVFILLIFFIVTASFIKEKSLNVNLSPKVSATPSEIVPTIFTVDANNNVMFENRVVSERAVRSLIAQKLAESPKDFSVVVNAHENSSVETYVSLLDSAKLANVSAVSLKSYK